MLPLGVCSPEVANLPHVAAWVWNIDAFRDLLQICTSGHVADAESWQSRRDRLDQQTDGVVTETVVTKARPCRL